METAAKTISLNTIDISYTDSGQGNNPLILIHGFPFDKTMWQQQIDFLQSSTRVISYDIRGFGKSTTDGTPFSIELFTYDLINFMNALEISKATICGLSMGGYICLHAMKQFPEHFDGMILCDTQCIADSAETKKKRFKSIEQIEKNGTVDFTEAFLKSVFYENSFITKKNTVENARKMILSTAPESLIGGLRALAERAETCSSLEAISVPVLIICGHEDQIIPINKCEYMYLHIKNASTKVIESAGHVSNLEQPDVFNNYVFDFLYDMHENAEHEKLKVMQ